MKFETPNRFLFIEPRSPVEHVFSRARIPRLGTILLGTLLRNQGLEVRVIIEDISGTPGAADLDWADTVCISSITSTIPRAYQFGDSAREKGKRVVYGGPHVTFLPEEALAHGDFVVRGEGEETLSELLKAWQQKEDLEKIAGLSFNREGQAVHNQPRPLIQDLDSLPHPDFTLVRGWDPRRAVLPLATSRGCPYACKFCSVVPMFGRGYRTRSIDLVLEEVAAHAGLVEHIFVCDDNFAANLTRAKDLLRRMKNEDLHPQWSTQVRAESAFDPEFLELLKETNCWGVYIGFESSNPEVLKAYRKNQDEASMKRAIEAFHGSGIHIHGMFIIGADQDTPETIRETVRFSLANRVDSAQFMMLTPLPGTETFQEMEKENRLLTKNWELYDGSHVVFRPHSMTEEELQGACYQAYLTFYSWGSILKRLVHLDLYYSYLRFYGRRLLKKAGDRMNRHRRWLAEDFRNQVQRQLGSLWKFRGIRKVALFQGNATEVYQDFLACFLTRLGVEVVAEKDPSEFFKHLRQKAEVAVVPWLRYVQETEKRLYPAWENLLAGLKEKLPEGLPPIEWVIDLKKESLYRSCVRYGLLFSNNLKKIRRAYQEASRLITPPPCPEPVRR